MRIILSTSLMVALAATGLRAQGQDALQAKYDAKLKQAWFTGGGWTTDFAAAKERAKKENKVVFAYFTRSFSP